MKFTSSIVAAILLSSIVAAGVARAEDKAGAAKAVEPQAEKAAAKPHSHVQEKTGVPPSAPDKKGDNSNAAKDKNKHFHPRDGK